MAAARSPATQRPALPTGAARRRKLHLGHFAFMRAVVQGLDLRASWDRYLRIEGEADDARLLRSTIAWIRDEFAAAAQRESRFGVARLVRLDAARLADPSRLLPALEDFAAQRGLEDFSQGEQIAAFEAEFGAQLKRSRARARLIARQLEALRWLEELVAQSPQAGDAVSAWLSPKLAQHLGRADVFTLAQLVERINGLGQGWFSTVPAIGATKAQRIVEWLTAHEASTGLHLGKHVRQARSELDARQLAQVVPAATAIRPLEKFIVPAELDGRSGRYRRPLEQCLLKASNDHEAILAWLASKNGPLPGLPLSPRAGSRRPSAAPEACAEPRLSHTQRAYRKEAERFLLWAIICKKTALSSLGNEDCAQYRDFLANPQPRALWCGSRHHQRWSPLWRPFEGPLSSSAQAHALTVLKNLYSFLVDQNYLMGNPWTSVAPPRSATPRIDPGRSLSTAQWAMVEARAAELAGAPDARSAQLRLHLALQLLYATGLRLSEVVAARLDDLQFVRYPAGPGEHEATEGWVLRVLGKGQRLREVPVPDEVIAQLERYLASRGLSPRIEDFGNQGAFLLGKASDWQTLAPGLAAAAQQGQGPADARDGIAAATLYEQLKQFFGGCAQLLAAQGDHRGAQRLTQASTHWLRHSHASHAIAAGMPIEIAQQNLGHASLATTTVYVRSEHQRRMKAVGDFWAKRKG